MTATKMIDHETGEVSESTAVVRVDTSMGIVRPMVNAKEAVAAWKEYQDLMKAVLDKDDLENIGGKEFKKKSAWRKFATFFNLSVECSEEKEIHQNDVLAFDVMYKATAPNGRSAYGDGSCESDENERAIKSRHDTRAMAHTRAFNRAVSNLIGGGEVSADEISSKKPAEPISTDTKFLFGKYKDKTIKEVGFFDTVDYCTYLKTSADKKNEPFKGQAKNILDFCLAEQAKKK
jgi:hypothetical protein